MTNSEIQLIIEEYYEMRAKLDEIIDLCNSYEHFAISENELINKIKGVVEYENI